MALSTTMLDGQVTAGGMVSMTVTVWLHPAELLQQSKAFHVRMIFHGQKPLVTVLWMVTATLVPQQVSEAVGGSKDQAEPHCTVLLPTQVMTGGLVSCTVTMREQPLVWPWQSVASQVSVISQGQEPLIWAETLVGVRATLQQLSQADGGLQGEPHWTVRLVQLMVGGGQLLVVVSANAISHELLVAGHQIFVPA